VLVGLPLLGFLLYALVFDWNLLLLNRPLGDAPAMFESVGLDHGIDHCTFTQHYRMWPGWIFVHPIKVDADSRRGETCGSAWEREFGPSRPPTRDEVRNPELDRLNVLTRTQQSLNAQIQTGALGGDPGVPVCRDDAGRTPEEKAFLQQIRKIAVEAGATEDIRTVHTCISDSRPHTLQIDSPDWCRACIANAFGEVKALIIRAKLSEITSINFCPRRFAGTPCEDNEIRAEAAGIRPEWIEDESKQVDQQTNPDPRIDWRGIEKRMPPLVLPPSSVIASVDKEFIKEPSRVAALGPKLGVQHHRRLAMTITEASIATGLKPVVAFYKSVSGYRQQPDDETVFEASFPGQQSSVFVAISSYPGDANKTHITLNRKTYVDK
jgi:hypothetical protein